MSATETYVGGLIQYSAPSEYSPPTLIQPTIAFIPPSEVFPVTFFFPGHVFIKLGPLPYEGEFRVTGVAKRKFGANETPTKARIVLMDEVTGNFVAQTYSDQNTGVYSFNNIANVKYTIMGFTDDGVPAVIADNIQPEPMP